MYVRDLEETKAFFIKYFGAKANELYHNTKTGFRSYFLSFESGARLEIMKKPDVVDEEKVPNRMGYIHISFKVGSKEQVDALTERLREDGYIVHDGPRMTGDHYYESCIVGVEGNMIEITA